MRCIPLSSAVKLRDRTPSRNAPVIGIGRCAAPAGHRPAKACSGRHRRLSHRRAAPVTRDPMRAPRRARPDETGITDAPKASGAGSHPATGDAVAPVFPACRGRLERPSAPVCRLCGGQPASRAGGEAAAPRRVSGPDPEKGWPRVRRHPHQTCRPRAAGTEERCKPGRLPAEPASRGRAQYHKSEGGRVDAGVVDRRGRGNAPSCRSLPTTLPKLAVRSAGGYATASGRT